MPGSWFRFQRRGHTFVIGIVYFCAFIPPFIGIFTRATREDFWQHFTKVGACSEQDLSQLNDTVALALFAEPAMGMFVPEVDPLPFFSFYSSFAYMLGIGFLTCFYALGT